MKSRAASKFWSAFEALPPDIQKAVVKQHQLWLADPRHPSLQFKKVGRFWSARVTNEYRALGVMDGDIVVWFWIGTHSEYERLLKAR